MEACWQGWPRPKGHITIQKGQEVLVTTDGGVARDNILPMEYAEFDKMCKAGDTLFVGRYLTNGADISSVYLDVSHLLLTRRSLPTTAQRLYASDSGGWLHVAQP